MKITYVVEKNKRYCGAGKSAMFIPQFIFNASCEKHDKYYEKGGGLVEKTKADMFFYAYMCDDISKGNYKFFKKYFYFFFATLYTSLVIVFGWVPWGVQYIKRRKVHLKHFSKKSRVQNSERNL